MECSLNLFTFNLREILSTTLRLTVRIYEVAILLQDTAHPQGYVLRYRGNFSWNLEGLSPTCSC